METPTSARVPIASAWTIGGPAFTMAGPASSAKVFRCVEGA